jgi:pyruvate/2-oxoglutarate/acetoin dehydrogenase E1 component
MREITYRDALREALFEEMRKDPRVFLIGEDIGVYGGAFAVTKGLLAEFGDDRVIDTPISEAAIVGTATGAAACGTRPVAEIMYVDFLGFAMDQIVNQAAKMRYMFGGKASVPMVIRTQGGAGKQSAAQHSQSLERWFIGIPGLKVVMPGTPHDAKGLLKSAIHDDNPVLFIEHKLLYNTKGSVPEGEYTVPIGKADVKREGKDVTIITYSRMLSLSLQAADKLAARGIDVEIIDLRTLAPLDMRTVLDSVKKTGRVVIVEEGHKTGGVAGELWAQITENAFDYLDAPLVRVTSEDVPMPCSPILESAALPSVDKIITAVAESLGIHTLEMQ